jgi:hypothetical protein
VKSTHVLGRSVARKRKPEEVFTEKEVKANQDRFEKLEKLLQLKTPDKSFREELVKLIGECRAFKSMWSDAPRRKLVHAELKTLQTAFRRQPEKLKEHLSGLSPEALLRLNLRGLDEETSQGEMKKVIQAAIKDTPKDLGGVAANEPLRFMVGQFSRLCDQKTRLNPALAYDAYSERHSGLFLECLSVVEQMIWNTVTDSEALAEVFKVLFYNKK